MKCEGFKTIMAIKGLEHLLPQTTLHHRDVNLNICSQAIWFIWSFCAHFDVLSLCFRGKDCNLHVGYLMQINSIRLLKLDFKISLHNFPVLIVGHDRFWWVWHCHLFFFSAESVNVTRSCKFDREFSVLPSPVPHKIRLRTFPSVDRTFDPNEKHVPGDSLPR